jgi:hypothetical protein
MALSAKQLAFVDEFSVDRNATRASVRRVESAEHRRR